MVNADPQGPKFLVEAFWRNATRASNIPTLLYCLHAHLRSACSPKITNEVFSDSQGALVQGWHVESQVQEDEEDAAPAEGAQRGARR